MIDVQNDQEQRRIRDELTGRSDGSDPFASAVRTTRMPMIVTDPRRPDNPIIFCNDAFLRLTGYARDEVIGRNCRFLQGAGTNADDVAEVRRAIDNRTAIEIDLLNYKKNGETFWNRLLVSPVFDGAELTYFFASQYDVTPERESIRRMAADQISLEDEIRRRVADLTQSEERLNFTLRSARLGAWTLDVATQRLAASNICKESFGRGETDSFTFQDLEATIVPADRARWRETIAESLVRRGDFDIEVRIHVAGGDERWIEMRGQPSFDASGQPLALAGVSLDISERKKAEEHRHLLVRELNHRVKNTLATVQSIVRQSLRSTRTVQEAAEAADSRIRALSMAHDVLTDENWSGAAMNDLVAQSLRPFFDESRNRIGFGGDSLRLKPRAALAISMALHELATNAVKYGALSNDAGHISLRWSIEGGIEGERRFAMLWEEKDGPRVEPPASKGFGSRLIERALASELGGTATIDYRPGGVVFSVDAPMEALSGPAD